MVFRRRYVRLTPETGHAERAGFSAEMAYRITYQAKFGGL